MRKPLKPPALIPGSKIAVVSPASPAEAPPLERGLQELTRLGYVVGHSPAKLTSQGYFAGSAEARLAELEAALADPEVRAVFCVRGGYGSNYLLGRLKAGRPRPKILLGYSDVTSLEIFLWRKRGWVTFYGPMVAAGFDAGPAVAAGYDADSFLRAVTETRSGWPVCLHGESLCTGEAEGVLLGGCLTLVETTLGTPWELDTAGSILLLEDRGMKPYQIDRALMHLKQAGRFKGVRGVVLGEFLESEPPVTGSPTVREVLRRILGELGVPVVWGAAVGHTTRPILTLPLGVRARLRAAASPQLDILEPAVTA